jgi:hypothetical protein
MTIHRITRAGLGTAAALAMLALARPVSATEGTGDLSLTLRLVETANGQGRGPSMTGAARIEVVLEAFRATTDVQLSVLRPDGSIWTAKGRKFATGPLAWTDPDGEPQEPGADGQTVPSRGIIRTTIVVPLEGADIHEIVVSVTGLANGERVATEGVVRAALGVPDNQPVDDGNRANFSLKGVK